MDAAISDSPKRRSKSGFSKTLLRKGMSRKPPPKRSQEELCAFDTTSAESGSGAAVACSCSSTLTPAALSAAAFSAAALRSASAVAMVSRVAFHCFVFSAFLCSSPTHEKASLEASMTLPKASLPLPSTLEEAEPADLANSLAFFSASLSSVTLSSRLDAEPEAEAALSFQLLSSSEVFEERLCNFSPSSSSFSPPFAPRCETRSDVCCTLSQSFFIFSSFSMSLFTCSMTCLMKLFLRFCRTIGVHFPVRRPRWTS
mmetsp:Transcript_87100/g.154120  ORF Transcript_87100/g.154120 Transcript_87100/m.154120 type:complete len:257 (+) Transcript_87100:530-1300(+)